MQNGALAPVGLKPRSMTLTSQAQFDQERASLTNAQAYIDMWVAIRDDQPKAYARALGAVVEHLRYTAVHQPLPAAIAKLVFPATLARATGQAYVISSEAFADVVTRGEPARSSEGMAPGRPACIAAALDRANVLAAMVHCSPSVSLRTGDIFSIPGSEDDIAPKTRVMNAMFWSAYYGASRSLEALYKMSIGVEPALTALKMKVCANTVNFLENKVPTERLHEALRMAILEDCPSPAGEEISESTDEGTILETAAAREMRQQRENGALRASIDEALQLLVKNGKIKLAEADRRLACEGWLELAVQKKCWFAATCLMKLGAPTHTVTPLLEAADAAASKVEENASSRLPRRSLLAPIIMEGTLEALDTILKCKVQVTDGDLVKAINRANPDNGPCEVQMGRSMYAMIARFGFIPGSPETAKDLFTKAQEAQDVPLSRLTMAQYAQLMAQRHKDADPSVVQGHRAECRRLANACDEAVCHDDFSQWFSGDVEADLGGEFDVPHNPSRFKARAIDARIRVAAKASKVLRKLPTLPTFSLGRKNQGGNDVPMLTQ